jgi:hypothetical protein
MKLSSHREVPFSCQLAPAFQISAGLTGNIYSPLSGGKSTFARGGPINSRISADPC